MVVGPGVAGVYGWLEWKSRDDGGQRDVRCLGVVGYGGGDQGVVGSRGGGGMGWVTGSGVVGSRDRGG